MTRAMGPLRHSLSDGVAVCAYALHPAAARRTARNHRRAAGVISWAEARRRARRSFRQYGRMAVDSLWAAGVTRDQVQRRAAVEGWEHVESARQAGRGAILAMCHFGSWDIAVTVGLARGLRIATVMAPVGPSWFTNVVAWERRRHGVELYGLDHAALGFVRSLRRGHFVGVMVDIPEHGPGAEVTFCRGPVRFSSVAAWLALRTGAPILPVDCWRAGHGYRLEVHSPISPLRGEDEAALTGRLAAVLERAVLRRPEQWYPFHEVYTR